jgi:hypothetical protein
MKHSEDLRKVAKRVVWLKEPEETLHETTAGVALSHLRTRKVRFAIPGPSLHQSSHTNSGQSSARS